MSATEGAGEIRGTASQLLTPQLMMCRQSLSSQHLDLIGNSMENWLKSGCYRRRSTISKWINFNQLRKFRDLFGFLCYNQKTD